MKPTVYKSFFICLSIFCSIDLLHAQQAKNPLLGKEYLKSASVNSISILNFTSSNSGLAKNITTVLGKKYESSISFKYKVIGRNVSIEYENTNDKEDYLIDLSTGKLISTHLEGYVDGKWGKIYWIEKKASYK